MYSVKRVIGGFAVYDETDGFVQKFTGRGAKAKANARADYLNGDSPFPAFLANEVKATRSRGNKPRGGARGGRA